MCRKQIIDIRFANMTKPTGDCSSVISSTSTHIHCHRNTLFLPPFCPHLSLFCPGLRIKNTSPVSCLDLQVILVRIVFHFYNIWLHEVWFRSFSLLPSDLPKLNCIILTVNLCWTCPCEKPLLPGANLPHAIKPTHRHTMRGFVPANKR